jgi:hypothetical protein
MKTWYYLKFCKFPVDTEKQTKAQRLANLLSSFWNILWSMSAESIVFRGVTILLKGFLDYTIHIVNFPHNTINYTPILLIQYDTTYVVVITDKHVYKYTHSEKLKTEIKSSVKVKDQDRIQVQQYFSYIMAVSYLCL